MGPTRVVLLDASVHKIQFLYVHCILTKFSQVTSIDLNAVGDIGGALVHLGVLAVGATLARLIRAQDLLARHEALRRASRASLLLPLRGTLKRRILSVSR